jgi:alpha-glucosidase
MAAERQAGDPASMLELYRSALRIRRAHPGLGSGSMRWLAAPEGVLSIEREGRFLLVVNVEGASVELPGHQEVLLSSGPLEDSRLPPDTAVWLQT